MTKKTFLDRRREAKSFWTKLQQVYHEFNWTLTFTRNPPKSEALFDIS
jgi:hypothetical protein